MFVLFAPPPPRAKRAGLLFQAGMIAMRHDRRIGIGFQALGVAMRAMLGEMDTAALERLKTAARIGLAREDQLAVAVTYFARRAAQARRDPAALRAEGRTFLTAIEIACLPDPVGLERRDIHG